MSISDRIRRIFRFRDITGVSFDTSELTVWHARAVAILLAIGLWYAMASIFPENLMPYPMGTVMLTWEMTQRGIVVPNLLATLSRTVAAFLLTMVLGTAVGIIMGTTRYGKKALTPYVIIGLSIPSIIFAAIATIIWGFSVIAPILATVMGTLSVVSIYIWKGVEDIDMTLVEMSMAFNISRKRLLLRMILPNIAPSLFGACRFGLALSWKIMTIAELFSAGNGVGYKLIQAYEGYRFQEAWAWGLVFVLVILVIEYGIFRTLERRIFSYRPESDLSVVGKAEA